MIAWLRARLRARARTRVLRRLRAAALELGFDLSRYTDAELEEALPRALAPLVRATTFQASTVAAALQAFASMAPTAREVEQSARLFSVALARSRSREVSL